MLETLYIKNLALVSELEIEFADGFNVVTGETGAGKSLVLGALQLLLGGRAAKSIIRQGADQCEICAQLRLPRSLPALAEAVAAILDDYGVPACEDNQLLLRRLITPKGNRVFVNSVPVTLQVLSQLAELLIDIHGPNNHYSLLRTPHQRDLLDRYAGTNELLAGCTGRHDRVLQCQRDLEALQSRHSTEAELEVLRYQLSEIDQADLRPGEETDLAERHAIAANARQLGQTANQCRNLLEDGEQPIAEQLALCIRLLQNIERIDTKAGPPLRENLENIAALLQDFALDLSQYADTIEVDQAELAELEERLDLIQRLKRKYARPVEDILAFADTIRHTLDTSDRRLEHIADAQTKLRQAQADLLTHCEHLSQARRQAAAELAQAISTKLQRLGFLSSRFEIRLEKAEPGPKGSDAVEFCFAPNPGEPLQPLRQIASSGEMARVMLAVKTVLTAADHVPILVFDEVDANIGGRIAVQVADELVALGKQHQTLCITHLPQIAAAGQRHFQVVKHVQDGRTLTTMLPLTRPNRERELARMLGAADNSEAAREHAREILEQRQNG